MIQNPGNLIDGFQGAGEGFSGQASITESDVEDEITILLAAAFASAPMIGVSAGELVTDGASTKVIRVEVTERTADQIKVKVEVDIAPGAGKTTTIEVTGYAVGPSQK